MGVRFSNVVSITLDRHLAIFLDGRDPRALCLVFHAPDSHPVAGRIKNRRRSERPRRLPRYPSLLEAPQLLLHCCAKGAPAIVAKKPLLLYFVHAVVDHGQGMGGIRHIVGQGKIFFERYAVEINQVELARGPDNIRKMQIVVAHTLRLSAPEAATPATKGVAGAFSDHQSS